MIFTKEQKSEVRYGEVRYGTLLGSLNIEKQTINVDA